MTSIFPGVALVTGAGSGIGRCCAESFAREGCERIVIADLSDQGLQETTELISAISPDTKTVSVKTDVANPQDVEVMLQKAISAFERIDYAVNAAGISGMSDRSHELSLENFDRITSVNYRGTWICSREELKYMINQSPLSTHDGRQGNKGSIVNIASQLGIVARPSAPAYCSAKAAIIGLTKSDAIDYSKDNIRVNCVCPGVIDTPMIEAMRKRGALEPAIAIAPMNRCGTPQEVADCVLFLCSSKATFIQGAALVVDGGYTIN